MNQKMKDFAQAHAVEVANQIRKELGIMPELVKEVVEYCKHDIPCIAAVLYMIYLGIKKEKISKHKKKKNKEECIQFLKDEENRINAQLIFKKESKLDYIIGIIKSQKIETNLFLPDTNPPSSSGPKM